MKAGMCAGKPLSSAARVASQAARAASVDGAFRRVGARAGGRAGTAGRDLGWFGVPRWALSPPVARTVAAEGGVPCARVWLPPQAPDCPSVRGRPDGRGMNSSEESWPRSGWVSKAR